MAIQKVILFTILVSLIVCDVGNVSSMKRTTTSRMFTKLRVDRSISCDFINRDFEVLRGTWNYVLRTVTSQNTPEIHCGHLVVNEILKTGFKSVLDYMTHEGKTVRVPVTGLFVDETTVGIPELNDLLSGNPNMTHPFLAEMGICDRGTILFVEPRYYRGGSMVLTRYIPDNINNLKIRFGTYDVQSGKEYIVRVPLYCTGK